MDTKKIKEKFEKFIIKRNFFVRLLIYIIYVIFVAMEGAYIGEFWELVVKKKDK
ncbi:MAG: hypothetical protein KH355_02435 [Clostridiales bacterium]|nr:hypothetical protein [Clostridiales bacterium]